MTGVQAFRRSQRARDPLDLASVSAVEELGWVLNSRPAAARVVAYLLRSPASLQLHPNDLASELADHVDGVGEGRAVRAALWVSRVWAQYVQERRLPVE